MVTLGAIEAGGLHEFWELVGVIGGGVVFIWF